MSEAEEYLKKKRFNVGRRKGNLVAVSEQVALKALELARKEEREGCGDMLGGYSGQTVESNRIFESQETFELFMDEYSNNIHSDKTWTEEMTKEVGARVRKDIQKRIDWLEFKSPVTFKTFIFGKDEFDLELEKLKKLKRFLSKPQNGSEKK